MKRVIMHIDVNNAFLSWTAIELLKKGYRYDIRNSYAVIGGDEQSRRGIVLAKSTPAKKMGVVTGETLYSARKKCPSLRSYPSNYKWYQEMSEAFIKVLKQYSPDIEQVSVDECYFDYGKVQNLYGDPILFAQKIQKEIYDTLGFTVNIGIANNKLCAKMASDFSKPNKIHTCYDEEVKEKLWPLDVGELFGVGKKSAPKLHELGIHTIGDLAQTKVDFLFPYFKNQAQEMVNSANGINDAEVMSTIEEPKGIGNETTLERDISNKKELYPYLMALSENVTLRLRKQKKYAYVVVVTLKDKYFRRMSHQKKLVNATNITSEVFETSKKILDEMWKEEPVRLIGIRLDNLITTSHHQVSFFENLEEREEDNLLEQTVDELKEKYGHKIIKKASLLNHKVGKKYLNQ